MIRPTTMVVLALAALATPVTVQAQVLGEDASACTSGRGPAVQVNVTGLKDRSGRLKLELYPATEEDFLKDDHDLVREGKTFRRIWAETPGGSGPVAMCIRVPHPGTFAILFTHDRDHKNKFNFWQDGAGFPSNQRLGRSRPKLRQALVHVGNGVAVVNVRAQYLRGLGGFGPLE